jgi:hypothetical protein
MEPLIPKTIIKKQINEFCDFQILEKLESKVGYSLNNGFHFTCNYGGLLLGNLKLMNEVQEKGLSTLRDLRSVPEASRPRKQVKNHWRACTQVLFLINVEVGFFHFLEIVTGWLVPSAGQKILLQPARTFTQDPACWKQDSSGR